MNRALALGLLLLLTACGGRPAPTLYSLRATPPDVSACHVAGGIRIHAPVVSPGLDSARIAVMDAADKQTFYKAVRWNAPVADMVQHYLADTLERAQVFSLVTTEDSTTRTPWQLETQLRAFDVDQSSGTPRVVIRLTASLVNTSSHNPIATWPLETEADASGLDMAGIAELFNRQMAEVTAQLIDGLHRKLPGCH